MTTDPVITWLEQSRFVAVAVALATLWVLESAVPMFVERKRRLSHLAANFGLAAINGALSFPFAFALLFVTEWAARNDFGLIKLVPMPAWSQWLAAILLIDCWQYWWHRINHRIPLFWRFHAVHHADAEMDVSSGVRFHAGEMAFSFLSRLVVLPLIGLSLPQLLLYEALSLPIILFHHSNVRIPARVDRCLGWLVVTPAIHAVHHSRHQPETDSNYASFLSFWDRMFRSFRFRPNPQDISMGLDGWQEVEWRTFTGMLAAPLKKQLPRRGE